MYQSIIISLFFVLAKVDANVSFLLKYGASKKTHLLQLIKFSQNLNSKLALNLASDKKNWTVQITYFILKKWHMKISCTPLLPGNKEPLSRYNLVSMNPPRVMAAFLILLLSVLVTSYTLYMHLKIEIHFMSLKQDIAIDNTYGINCPMHMN